MVWRFVKRPIEIAHVHISSLRNCKFNINSIEAYLKPIQEVNALSRVARPILSHERKTPEWSQAIEEHAHKLIALKFAMLCSDTPPSNPTKSFFVGRNIDGKLNARLVANGGLTIEGQTLDQYLPSISERFSFLSVITAHLKKGFVPWSGDISGAYYATAGNGFIQLPHNWPRGVGGFSPLQTVQLLCAIPGDRLSSGLF